MSIQLLQQQLVMMIIVFTFNDKIKSNSVYLITSFESGSEDEDDENDGGDIYENIHEFINRLDLSLNAEKTKSSINQIAMEINCYRRSVNCNYLEIIRVGGILLTIMDVYSIQYKVYSIQYTVNRMR